MTTSALAAVSALHALITNADKLAAFEHFGRNSHASRPLALRQTVLYAGVPRLARELGYYGVERFARILTPAVRCTPNCGKDALADVQSGLIALMRQPELFDLSVAACPELAELLAIPAFGWLAYDDLLNHPSPRCFGGNFAAGVPHWYGRSVSRFDTRADSIDAIYITDWRGGHYAERLPLPMPEAVPATFGEELRALDQMGMQALRLFDQCRQRGQAFRDQAPDAMYLRFHGQFRQAVRLPEQPQKSVPAARPGAYPGPLYPMM